MKRYNLKPYERDKKLYIEKEINVDGRWCRFDEISKNLDIAMDALKEIYNPWNAIGKAQMIEIARSALDRIAELEGK
jgi:hypothetical protein